MMLILRKCHRLFYLGLFGIFYVLLYPLLYFFSRTVSRYRTLNPVRRFYAFACSTPSGFFYRREYETEIDWSKTYVICANHTSNLDIPAILTTVKSNFAFMGKEELLYNRFLKLFFETIDIPLNRESKISAFKAFRKGSGYLEAGISLVIFPEGKIGDEYPPILHSFKSGPFRLAIERQVPVIPISMKNNWEKMWDDGAKYGTRPGICDIRIHAPVETKGLTLDHTEALTRKIYDTINSGVNGYR